jgi:5'(3')-deoxyribonucleotidase
MSGIHDRFIGVDLDGVIANSHEGIISYIKTNHGVEIKLEDITDWGYLERKFGKQESLKIYRAMWEDWQHVNLMEPDAVKYVNDLHEYGKVFIVTGRQDFRDVANVTQWLANSGLKMSGLLTVNILSRYKVPKIAFAPPFNVYIDDNPEIAFDAINNGVSIFLRDQPWNRGLPADIEGRLTRIHSLEEVIKRLKL